MKEIPVPYVRSNQTGIVLTILLAIILQLPALIIALLGVQLLGLIFGPRANLFIVAARPFLAKWVAAGHTEAAELQRFNNIIGVSFLTLSTASFLAGWTLAGYIIAGMMAAAAAGALLGYCIGCTIYFQYKQLRAKQAGRL